MGSFLKKVGATGFELHPENPCFDDAAQNVITPELSQKRTGDVCWHTFSAS
jgi:hypothetical protein